MFEDEEALYDHEEGEAQPPWCRHCRRWCDALLSILCPLEPIRRYPHNRRYIFRCSGCGSTNIMLESKSRKRFLSRR